MRIKKIQYLEKSEGLAEVLFPEKKPGPRLKKDLINQVRKRINKTIHLNHSAFINYNNIKNIDGKHCLIPAKKERLKPLSAYLQEKGSLSLTKIVDWGIKITEIAAEAEEKNLNLPGITLNSIRLDKNQELKMMDTALVKIIEKYRNDLINIIGQENYLPPELIKNNQWDQQSRIYSAGVVLYYLATGKAPFFAPSKADIYDKIISGSFIEPRYLNTSISITFNNLIYKMINKKRKKRYKTWNCIKEDLKKLKKQNNIIATKKEKQKNISRKKLYIKYNRIKQKIKISFKRNWKIISAICVIVIIIWGIMRTTDQQPVLTEDFTPEEVVVFFYDGFMQRRDNQMAQATKVELGELTRLISHSYIIEQMQQYGGIFSAREPDEKDLLYGLKDINIEKIDNNSKPVFKVDYVFFLNENGRKTRDMEDILYLEQVDNYWQIVNLEGGIKKLITGELKLKESQEE